MADNVQTMMFPAQCPCGGQIEETSAGHICVVCAKRFEPLTWSKGLAANPPRGTIVWTAKDGWL